MPDDEILDPPYYQRTELQPREVVYRWYGVNGVCTQALKYIYRATIGHKPGASAKEDLGKAVAWLQYAIQMLHKEEQGE
jgi:hypothetical protein